MKNWQKNRNYRRLRLSDGSILNIITVDGIDVEVTDEVYEAYSQMDRQERYQEEIRKIIPHVSLEKLSEADVPIDIYTSEHVPSAEDAVLEMFEEEEKISMIIELRSALAKLTPSERELVETIYFDGISAREYARTIGISDMAVRKRRDRILVKLKIFLKK